MAAVSTRVRSTLPRSTWRTVPPPILLRLLQLRLQQMVQAKCGKRLLLQQGILSVRIFGKVCVQRVGPAHEAAATHAAVQHKHRHDSILQADATARTQPGVRLRKA